MEPTMRFPDLEDLIDAHRGDAVDFGDANCDLNPTPARVAQTEAYVGAKLPPSYLWFTTTYDGGEVYGEEFFFDLPILRRTISASSPADTGIRALSIAPK
jgi:hypothetical protein